MIRVGAFRSLPEMAKGYSRDISVRWALEEIGQDYEVRLFDHAERATADYRKLQPFGLLPIYEENDFILFESGAIVLHIAEKSEVLLPKNPKKRAQVQSWMFAAMNTIDPLVKNFELVQFSPGEEWAKLRRPSLVTTMKTRLSELAKALDDKAYLAGTFSAADILMAMSLRNLGQEDVIIDTPSLLEYVKRCESRPAFQKAMAKHLAVYS